MANFRVFWSAQGMMRALTLRRRQLAIVPEEVEQMVHTSSFSIHPGQENESTGSGVWFKDASPDNTAIQVLGDHRSKRSGATHNTTYYENISLFTVIV